MKKYFIIISAVLSAVLFGILIALFIYSFGKEKVENDQNNNVPVVDDVDRPATAYGVKMQNECFEKFQDFVKTYGADYSKCLVDFDFKEEYCGGFDPDTQALSDMNVVVILDSSGSMAGEIGSQRKIDIAKKAVSDFLIEMPKGVNTGLVVYGHKGSNYEYDKDLSCNGVEEIVKLGMNNSENIVTAMRSFDPRGWTPIAGSLNFAKDIFSNSGKGDKNYLILVSDGVESCDGDPLTAAANIKAEVQGIKLIVIGFVTDSQTRDFLKGIATRAGGSYLSADNSSNIAEAFNNQLLVVKKDCLEMTFSKMSFRYKTNNLNNLNCWLSAQKKESDDFDADISSKPFDTKCNLEISDALRARHTEFWYKIKELEEKNDVIYKEVELDYNNQLEAMKGS